MSGKEAQSLLNWFARSGRNLPWRVKGGAHPDPYIVFVSEIMLQQTTVQTVIPYFYRFIERFPNIQTLASADEDEVLQYWQGLGYYSRARSLWQSAQMIVNDMKGTFPDTVEKVKKLKGFGPYTIASFLVFAFNKAETVVDGNVIRIICRMYHLTAPKDEIKEIIFEKAAILTDQKNPADYASAIMDLGALICTPKRPKCSICPWIQYCQSFGCKDIEKIPTRTKIVKKTMDVFVYVVRNTQGEFFIRKRDEGGLLSGLYEFPWSETQNLFENAVATNIAVRHVFTHINMNMHIMLVKSDQVDIKGRFVEKNRLREYALSTLMKKVLVKVEKI